MQRNVERYQPDKTRGLSLEQVEKRKSEHLVHFNTEVPTKSIKQIILGNFFTLFNLLNLGLGLAIFLVGSYKNLLFLGVVFCNMAISIFQEIRAKKTIDQLSLFSQSKVVALRDGKKVEIQADEIVLDDVLCLSLGNQVLVDSIVLSGECLVNEAFITGEETPILKKVGDSLLSGSFLVRGNVVCQCDHIGEDNYTSKISKDAKYLKKLNSELMISLQKIIKTLSIVIIPIGIFLFWGQMRIPDNTIPNAIIRTVAGLIGMIPDGLVLLTSTVLAVSVLRLSKYKVLVQELYCIEMLARVDILCLDKTGTLTEGKMELKDIVLVPPMARDKVMMILKEITSSLEDSTPTMEAVRQYANGVSTWKVIRTEAFSSETKCSKVTFAEQGTYILGAPEFILPSKKFSIQCSLYEQDYRLLLLAHEDGGRIVECAYLLIQDKVREQASRTIEYFKQQGVSLKIISGDNPVTVAQIAKRVGVDGYDHFVDLSLMKTEEELANCALKYTIFGRVSPMQKKTLVQALQKQGHTVAMTGDGVNDVLALKQADCSIAIASGSQAAKSVSQLVLLDSNFDSMPKIVSEGRRTINNIQRSASLFLVKTIYTTLLAVLFLFLSVSYPFEPIQMSLTNMVTIGIPSFLLALEVNKDRVKGGFLTNVISKSFPTALTIFCMIFIVMLVGHFLSLTHIEVATLSVFMVAMNGFSLLYRISVPFTKMRRILFISMVSVFLLEIIFLRDLFSIAPFSVPLFLILIGCIIGNFILSFLIHFLCEKGKKIFSQKRK